MEERDRMFDIFETFGDIWIDGGVEQGTRFYFTWAKVAVA